MNSVEEDDNDFNDENFFNDDDNDEDDNSSNDNNDYDDDEVTSRESPQLLEPLLCQQSSCTSCFGFGIFHVNFQSTNAFPQGTISLLLARTLFEL